MLFICVTTLLVFVGVVVAMGCFVSAVDGVLKCVLSSSRFAAFGYGCGVGFLWTCVL